MSSPILVEPLVFKTRLRAAAINLPYYWSEREGLNFLPFGYQPNVLPDELLSDIHSIIVLI